MLNCQTADDDAANAVAKFVQSDQTVFIHGGAATPNRLIDGLLAISSSVRNVELIHLHTIGPARYADPEFSQSFRVTSLFIGENLRSRIDHDRIDYLPCFLSEIPQLFCSKRKAIDVALIHVSPPDTHGYCSLGVSVDVARAAVDAAKYVIAQINAQMPRVHGEGVIHISKINASISINEPLPEVCPTNLATDRRTSEQTIGELIAGLVEDGSTLQMGIGAIPDAALAALKNHRHLGIHTEMFSDRALDLIECGAVDNSQKKVYPGLTVSSFCIGSQRLYRMIHDNPSFSFLPANEVNNVTVISRNPKVVAINSAIEVDLTGQVCADSIGPRIISGVGGQMDFIRGASLSPGGRPIIALCSRTAKGQSKISPTLRPGAGVVTTRAHVHYIVTEYGIADLYGKTIKQRAESLIAIAHPDDRERLSKAWWALTQP